MNVEAPYLTAKITYPSTSKESKHVFGFEGTRVAIGQLYAIVKEAMVARDAGLPSLRMQARTASTTGDKLATWIGLLLLRAPASAAPTADLAQWQAYVMAGVAVGGSPAREAVA